MIRGRLLFFYGFVTGPQCHADIALQVRCHLFSSGAWEWSEPGKHAHPGGCPGA